ncbi:MAG: hypothetical protein A2X18_01245 [Bacteroidetes bacterium GWF2_40_14]|nr:MAG: hypothetical protein A2X18_01245 [Bacteroidetes bacterium GWF2_40_14]
MKTIGIIIIVIGLGLAAFSFVTVFTKEKVVDLGKLEITRDKPHNLNVSPLVSIAVIGLGGILVWLSYKKK